MVFWGAFERAVNQQRPFPENNGLRIRRNPQNANWSLADFPQIAAPHHARFIGRLW
jgi:hypothetical protein